MIGVTSQSPSYHCKHGRKPMDDMARRVGLIRDLSSRLGHLLAGLSREAWTRPSACALWAVREVVAHLTGGAERQMQSMVRGRKGDAAPPLRGYACGGKKKQAPVWLHQRMLTKSDSHAVESQGTLCENGGEP